MTLERPTTEALADYVGAGNDEYNELARCIDTAATLVDSFISSAFREVPQAIYEQAVLDTAQAVFKRRASDNSSGGLAPFEGGFAPIEPNDPLQKSVPILRRYVTPF